MVTIRPTLADDEDAVAAILEPICATGEVFCAPPDGGRAGALGYWGWGIAGTRVFLAETDGRPLGTYYLRANQKGNGSHVANAGYATDPQYPIKLLNIIKQYHLLELDKVGI